MGNGESQRPNHLVSYQRSKLLDSSCSVLTRPANHTVVIEHEGPFQPPSFGSDRYTPLRCSKNITNYSNEFSLHQSNTLEST